MALFPTLLSLLLGGVYALLMERFRKTWLALSPREGLSLLPPSTRVSVVVPARNEAARLAPCLHSVLGQDYPADLLEIIVVDDFSEDETASIAQALANRGVRLVHAEVPGKKQALLAGIRAASGELIASLDADCMAPAFWLRTMVSTYEEKRPVLLAGPVEMEARDSFLERFQALDLLGMSGLAAAGISGGYFHLGNGANLLYERMAFWEVNAFEGVDHLASGDDVLLMQKVAAAFPGRLTYVKSPAALVRTFPETSWRGFLRQRLRWGGKASHYQEQQLTALAALVLLLCVWIVASLLATPWLGLWPFVLALGLKAAADYRFLAAVSHFFSRGSLMGIFGKAQLVHVLYIAWTGTLAAFQKGYSWKGRHWR